MRIAFVAARYLPYVGGTEIHTAEVATRLAAAGHDVSVLTTDPWAERPTTERRDGVTVVRVPSRPRRGDWYVAPGLAGALRRGRWDVVHVQGYHTFVAPVAMAAAVATRHPFVVTFHSGGHASRVRQALRPLHRWALRPLLARADRLIGVSAFEADLFTRTLRLPGERFAVVPGGGSLPTGPPAGGSPGPAPAAGPGPLLPPEPDDGRRVICSVGRVERYKGHHRLVGALPRLRATVPGVELWIVGDGPFRSSVERLARRLGVADAVRFTPVPAGDRAGMAALLRRADLVVSLSQYESQGLAVWEALALGRPVLVADGSALGELVAAGEVRAVPPRCGAGELAAAVSRCLAEPLRPTVVELPRWDEHVASLLAIYRGAVAR